jgi:large subunit ribosomal protein L23
MTEENKKINVTAPKEILIGVRMTEKSALMSDKNVYTFNVAIDATKSEVKKEIKRIYSVTPKKVNMIKSKGKNVVVRNRKGVKKDTKKAMVYLKDGDKINVM